MNDTPTVKSEEVTCPFCKTGKITVTITSEFFTYKVSRISSKSERIPVYHEEKIEVHGKCPECGKTSHEIREAVGRGVAGNVSHEDRISRMKKSGIPTRIEG